MKKIINSIIVGILLFLIINGNFIELILESGINHQIDDEVVIYISLLAIGTKGLSLIPGKSFNN